MSQAECKGEQGHPLVPTLQKLGTSSGTQSRPTAHEGMAPKRTCRLGVLLTAVACRAPSVLRAFQTTKLFVRDPLSLKNRIKFCPLALHKHYRSGILEGGVEAASQFPPLPFSEGLAG